MKKIYYIALVFLLSISAAVNGFAQEYISTKRSILITDAIGEGKTKEIAKNNALYDAEQKALRRVTSTFRHILSDIKDGELMNKRIQEEVHARIIDKPDIKKEEYPFETPYVCMLEVYVTVKFLDLDFFAEEIKKTAEGACVRSLFVAGWGQAYNRNYFGAVVNFGLTYGALGYGYYREQQIDNSRANYLNAKDPESSERAYRKLQNDRNVSKTMYAIGIVSWIYSVWDAFEDRERTNRVMQDVHQKYFKKFPYTRYDSFMQRMMYSTRPSW